MAKINLVAIIKILHIICKILFIFLLAIGEVKKELLKLIFNCFIFVKIKR